MSSLVKKALKTLGLTKKDGKKGGEEKVVVVHVHHHHYHGKNKQSDPTPKNKAKKCPNCDGTGEVTKWENPPYGKAGYWSSCCCECKGKKYIVVYDFER